MREILRVGAILLGALAAANGDRHVGLVTGLAVDDGRVLSVSQAGIGLGTGEDVALLQTAPFRITALAVVRGEEIDGLLAVGGEPGRKAMLALYQPSPGGGAPGEPIKQELPGGDLLYGVAVSPDGKLAALAGADGSVWCGPLPRAGGPPEWKVRHRHTAAARAVAFSPDGRWLASGGLDGVVMLSPVGPNGPTEPRKLLDHTAGVECLAFSRDSKSLASGSRDSRVRLHTVDGKLVRTYQGLGMDDEPVAGRVPSRILAVAWGDRLVAGTSKGTLHRLAQQDEKSERLPMRFDAPVGALAIDSAGRLVVGTRSVKIVSLKD